ncbi:hypothetical protein [Rufibacter sp. XAAS-G3-1]|uniref:hypothetical protein n=1 Tax=Rufibacter sp. XAAS-G3-1 TaxID=2729134 RepID=UPI0015E75D20|nr:hypothetical protein [Rufibacter sp. XAAS-G3-1]
MKRLAFFSLLLLSIFYEAKAQEGYTRLSLSAGIMHKEAYTGTVALEFGKSYLKYLEVFADAYKSQVTNTENYLGGVAFKPNITRATNRYLNFRVGAGVGSNTNNVIAGLQAGFEAGYIFKNNIVLMLHQKNEGIIGAKDHPLRTGLLFGFKFPL